MKSTRLTKKAKHAILTEVLESLNKRPTSGPFICNLIWDAIECSSLYLDFPVHKKHIVTSRMMAWFKTKKPSEIQYEDFFNHYSFVSEYAWWDNKEYTQRKKFVSVLLKELES
jgi:hypothetical protein